MAKYQRMFVVPDVAQVHLLFLELATAARVVDAKRAQAGLPPIAAATRREVLVIYDQFITGLNELARFTATDATKQIQARLKETAKRPDTGVRPHLRNGIRSRPIDVTGRGIATGAVGVADEASLNKVKNPNSPKYGPYWRAQEFGTGSADVRDDRAAPKSQIGREIVGYFFDRGKTNPTVPQKGRSDQPIFITGRSAGAVVGSGRQFSRAGKGGGRGIIGKEIEGRHFIRDGSDQAVKVWRANLRAIERNTMRKLNSTLTAPPSTGVAAARRRARRTAGPTRRRPPRF
jgi:hypothetical protein